MAKKIVILEGSPRKGGNTDLLSDAFMRGAKEEGSKVTKFYLAQKEIHPCMGCGACRRSEGHNCVFKDKDDFEEIIQAVIGADVLVVASPVYFYSLTAQTKTAIDRFYAREMEIKDKTAYFITACAAPGEEYMETAKACFRGFISCFQNVVEGGIIAGPGCGDRGAVADKPVMQDAYEMGKLLFTP